MNIPYKNPGDKLYSNEVNQIVANVDRKDSFDILQYDEDSPFITVDFANVQNFKKVILSGNTAMRFADLTGKEGREFYLVVENDNEPDVITLQYPPEINFMERGEPYRHQQPGKEFLLIMQVISPELVICDYRYFQQITEIVDNFPV